MTECSALMSEADSHKTGVGWVVCPAAAEGSGPEQQARAVGAMERSAPGSRRNWKTPIWEPCQGLLLENLAICPQRLVHGLLPKRGGEYALGDLLTQAGEPGRRAGGRDIWRPPIQQILRGRRTLRKDLTAGTSPMVYWLRLHLPVPGFRFNSWLVNRSHMPWGQKTKHKMEVML